MADPALTLHWRGTVQRMADGALAYQRCKAGGASSSWCWGDTETAHRGEPLCPPVRLPYSKALEAGGIAGLLCSSRQTGAATRVALSGRWPALAGGRVRLKDSGTGRAVVGTGAGMEDGGWGDGGDGGLGAGAGGVPSSDRIQPGVIGTA